MLVMGVAPVLAPGLGSVLMINHSWRAIFIFLAAFTALLFLLSVRFLPESKAANPDDKISGALKKYLGILRDKNFLICACSGGLAMAGLFSYITAAPFIYMKIFQLSAQNFSLIFSVNAIGFIAASQINARLLKKFSIEKILQKLIFLPLFLGLLLVATTALNPTFWPITILFFLLLSSIGAMIPNTTALALANQAAHSGSASALLGTIQFVIATICSLLISKFSNEGILALGIIFGSTAALSFLTYKIFRRH
jgi:DHA1 family bicyclomycin/chloramphenicol resistance-like MFS transporter